MKIRDLIYKLVLLCLAVSLWPLHSCNSFREYLPECRLYVQFSYDHNMLSADVFHKQVDKVELYIFDTDGIFLFKQTDEGALLAREDYRMEVFIPTGRYRFIVWAGAHDSYEIASLIPGTSDIEELKLKLKRSQNLIIDKELEPLWYGEITDVDFTGRTTQTEVVSLIKDTNKLRFVFQGQTPAWTINVDDYSYQILESNGYLNYDNSLLSDDILSYEPYHTKQESAQAAAVELNTMRLMADRQTRFVVTHKATGNVVFDIDLVYFLRLTEMEMYNTWDEQEYFDRKDEYVIVFFFSEQSDPDGPWVAVRVNINTWTWYFQTEG
ncbi:MAG: FimB/Mfa2 family fimbrial subunit [Bacteroidales bacterium]|jgi:hypothetical protein|nr:FimB/Mfa2 family fimbrial subunit [Bacteroidales bacterium]